jgi:hypothetical protein
MAPMIFSGVFIAETNCLKLFAPLTPPYAVADAFDGASIPNLLFGFGPGSVDIFANVTGVRAVANPHAKASYEYGFVGSYCMCRSFITLSAEMIEIYSATLDQTLDEVQTCSSQLFQ